MHYLSESSWPFTLTLNEQLSIKRALTILDKHLLEPGIIFTSPQTVRDWLRLKMARLKREKFMVLYFSQQNQLTGYETLFSGTIRTFTNMSYSAFITIKKARRTWPSSVWS